jgi:hypothetical protein
MHANPLCKYSAENQMKKIQKPPEEYSKYKNVYRKGVIRVGFGG